MRYHLLACDYDETLAQHGQVTEDTVRALERLSRAGIKLVLVTGRELDDLLEVFPHPELFDLIVAENGALVYHPHERTREALADPPPVELVDRLRQEGVTPLGAGHVIVATREPYDVNVLNAIRDLGLELQVIYNKGAVMALPSGVNKATGLTRAVELLKLSTRSAVGVGDAENDHAFLTAVECGAVVANALPSLAERCDLVLTRERGDGVVELAEMLLSGELDEVEVPRRHVLLGNREDQEVRLPPYGVGLMVAGPSGSGKSTVTAALLERVLKGGYQCVVIDPEGDYAEHPGIAVLGDPDRAPGVDQVLELLEQPDASLVVNMIGMALRDRPAFFAELLPRLASMRARTGHPHWLVVDEAHHLMPAELREVSIGGPGDVGSLVLITVHPEAVSPAARALVTDFVAVGEDLGDTLAAFAQAHDRPATKLEPAKDSDIALWRLGEEGAVELTLVPAQTERTRHRRKYAAGTMSEGKSFYFVGPEGRLRLRARNLHTFVELAEGVDDETWLHHLRQGDYSAWIRESLGDDELADELAAIEQGQEQDAARTRQEVAGLIEARYTLPAEPTDYDPGHH